MPKTILLADDSVTIQKVVGISFASEDAIVVTVDNGDDAILKTREIRPDIVLADVVMPGKNGYEVCQAITNDPELAHIPVLLLTGTFEAFDEARARAVGSAGHIAKPFEASALVAEVRRLTDSASAKATAKAPAKAPASPQAAPTKPAAQQAVAADAFDFFDDEIGGAEIPPAELADEMLGDFEFQGSESAIAFDDDVRGASADSRERFVPVTPDVARAVEAVEVRRVSSHADAAETSAPFATSRASAAVPVFDDSLDDSLSPDASRGGDRPFDFALSGEIADSTDPLAEFDLMPPVDADDLAQATVIDPLGASGYDVSSSDLGPPMRDTAPDLVSVARARQHEAELTVLAADVPLEAKPILDDDSFGFGSPANDLTRVVREDPVYANFAAPRPLNIAVEEDDPESWPSRRRSVTAQTPRADRKADSAAALIAKIGPELRQQLHDTLEKIAWESFGDLTEAIVRQSVERVESIAWEVIPRMAETLIEEEIRRMKNEPEDA